MKTERRAPGALGAEIERVAATLDALDPSDWGRPTRCPPMTVLHIVAHVMRGGIRIKEMLAAGPVDAQPETDGATYFRYDPEKVGPGVVQRAAEAAAEIDPVTAAGRWKTECRSALAAAAAALEEGDPVLPGVFGLIRLSEYLRTRVVEMVIHHTDIRDALGADPDPDPDALDVTCDVLAALLGTDPRVLGMDGVRFALIGTGRARLSDGERTMLGPLAERLPVIS